MAFFMSDRQSFSTGFVRTWGGVVSGEGEDAKFVGLLMEKLNGKELEKRLWRDESWANAKYTLEMLRQVRQNWH